MAAVYDSTQTFFPGQYGQSRLSFHADSAHFGGHGDRSRVSAGSFVTSTDLAPDTVPMEFAFSDSSFSEPDMEWMNLIVDSDSTSPMPNNPSEQEFFPTSWSSHGPQTTQGCSIPQRVTSLEAFQFPQFQQSPRPLNQGKTA